MLEDKMDFRKCYPFSETLMLFSGNERKSEISDMDALFSYLNELCEDTDSPKVQRLLPITSLEMLTNRKEIFLESIEFCGYDFSWQDMPAVEGKIASVESVFGSTITALWQPNFFRPSVRIGGEDVTSNIYNPTPGAEFHDLGIGFPLPFCVPVNKIIKDTKDIDIYASYAQAFKDEVGLWKYRNYALQAIITFWHNRA
ncbi:MAG: hypothetical protein LBO69_05550 [Ignavibacteria bacterium]|jgi:hypothetical protein|nr:hypothetical protein [Ignavibacteria bacterium]